MKPLPDRQSAYRAFHSNYGTFVPTYFRSQERKYHRWNFCSLVLSLPGTFAPGSESYMELSLSGTLAPRNFSSLELSPLYQYEKRITVALDTKECSSLPTNATLQSVLTYRHVRRTYDAGWHGIGKDYEVVIERIDCNFRSLGHRIAFITCLYTCSL